MLRVSSRLLLSLDPTPIHVYNPQYSPIIFQFKAKTFSNKVCKFKEAEEKKGNRDTTLYCFISTNCYVVIWLKTLLFQHLCKKPAMVELNSFVTMHYFFITKLIKMSQYQLADHSIAIISIFIAPSGVNVVLSPSLFPPGGLYRISSLFSQAVSPGRTSLAPFSYYARKF